MRKLMLTAAAFCAAVFLAAYVIPYSALFPTAAAAAAAGVLCLIMRRKKALCMVLAAVLGLVWFSLFYSIRYRSAEELAGCQTQITARAVRFSSETKYGSQVRVKLTGDGFPGLTAILWLNDRNAEISPGDVLTLEAELEMPSSGGLDDYYPGIGVFLFAYQRGEISAERSGFRLRYAHVYLAEWAGRMAEKLYSQENSAVMKALLLGDKRELNKDQSFRYMLQRSGLSHLVAVSGMHVSFLMAMLFLIIPDKRAAYLAGIPVIMVFMGMTGFSPGVVRAGIMQIFVIIAYVAKREEDSLTSLAFAMAVLLAVNPFSAKSISLQMSFASTVGLVLFSQRLRDRLTSIRWISAAVSRKSGRSRLLRSAVNFIVSAVSATMCAMVFTVPLSAVWFGSVSLAAPLSNLLVLWAASAVFGLGMLSLPLGAIWLPLGKAAAWPASAGIWYFRSVVKKIGSFGLSSLETGSGYIRFWLIATYILLIIWFIIKDKEKKLYLPMELSGILLAVCLLLSWTDEPGVTVSVLDVGQGSCTVITTQSAAVVVDCGGSGVTNAGAAASAYLRSLGHERVDMLVFTHCHTDHANGTQVLCSQLDVSCMAVPPQIDGVDVTRFAQPDTKTITVSEPVGVRAGDLTIELIPPLGTGSNEDGLGVICSYGSFDTVITGDMGSENERKLTEFCDLPDAELLVVGHHGSRNSTCEPFLRTIKPEIAVISVGIDNGYGHPSSEVLERLENENCTVLRTDFNGTVTVKASGE